MASASCYSHVLTYPTHSPLHLSLFSSSFASVSTNKTPKTYAATTPPHTATGGNKATTTRQKRNSKSYLARQAALLEVQHSPDLYSALERLGGMLRVQELNVILRNLGHESRWKDLDKLFNWMQWHRKVSPASYSSYIKFIGKSLNPVKALDIYDSISDESTKVNVFVCNSLLTSLVRNGRLDISMKLFRKMKHNGLLPDVITYSMLLAGCIKSKDGYSKAMDLLQELRSDGIKMDNVMYGTLLAVCASHKRCNEAQRFFDQMMDDGLLPNSYHYSSLLNAYSTIGDYKSAEGLIQDMRSSELVPNKVIMTTLLKVYVKGGLFEKAKALLNELAACGFAEDEIPYCILMDGFSKTGQISEARTVFEELNSKSVKSDGYAHGIMISAFYRGGLLEEAKLLAKDFESKYDKYDVVILNTLLCAYCRAGEMEDVMGTMKKMDKLSIIPDYNTFHILVKYFCTEKLYLLAYQTLEDMHRKGHQPGEEICSCLIFHLGKIEAYQEAFAVYNMLRYSKTIVSQSLHEKVLHILIAGRLLKEAYVIVKDKADLIPQRAIKKFMVAFVKLGNINMINDVIKVMHGTGYELDQELFQLAISRYLGEPEKKDLLLLLLHWMVGQGFVLDSSTRNLIKSSHLFGRQAIAEIFSKKHKSAKGLQSL